MAVQPTFREFDDPVLLARRLLRTLRLLAHAHPLDVALTGAFERLQNEKGQGSVEYSGIVLLVAALVAAAIAAASTDVISGLVKEMIGDAFDKLS